MLGVQIVLFVAIPSILMDTYVCGPTVSNGVTREQVDRDQDSAARSPHCTNGAPRSGDASIERYLYWLYRRDPSRL
jgi:hypothetical protein